MKIKLTKTPYNSALKSKFGYELAQKMYFDKTAPDIFVEGVPTKTEGVYTVDMPAMVLDTVTGGVVSGTKTVKVKVYGNKVGTFNRYTENTNEVGIVVE